MNKSNSMKSIISLFLFLTTSMIFPPYPGAAILSEMQSRMDELVGLYARLERFSGSVLVARDGEVIFSNAYGMANWEHEVPNTVLTKYNISSLTKSFVAAAVLQLESQGKLHLDDPIIKYLPGYPEADGRRITIHHALTHSSGIPSIYRTDENGGDIIGGNLPVSVEGLISLFKDKKPLFNPGEKFRYSNSGYVLLGAIIESISKQRLADYLYDNIFVPAEMMDTGCFSSETIVPGRADGYLGFGCSKINAPFEHSSWAFASGGILSTVADLLKWDTALYGNTVLNEDGRERLFKPYIQTDVEGARYSYGWFINELYGKKLIYHTGGFPGFGACHFRFPGENIAIIVLSNYTPRLAVSITKEIAGKLGAIIFDRDYTKPPSYRRINPDVLEKIAGVYRFREGFFLILSSENGELWATTTGENAWSIFSYENQIAAPLSSTTVKKAVRFFNDLTMGEFQNAVSYFDERLKEGFTVDKLRNFWTFLVKEQGLLVRSSVVEVADNRNLELQIVTIRCEFENEYLNFEIALNRNGRIITFYHNKTNPSKIRLIPDSENRFFADGFMYDLPDVSLTVTFDSVGNAESITIGRNRNYTGKRIP